MDDNKKYKSILIRLSPELHKKMRHLSIESGLSINTYVVKALEEIVKINGKEQGKNE